MATPNYSVNYNDSRFKQVENEKNKELNNVNNTYNEMINNSDKYYQQQIKASKDWQKQQQQIQQANTDFAIEKIEQQKEQAKQDYTKEQRGAYTDYQKATNQYGANAEQLATQGLTNTGYSESTITNMYNTYQNRYTSARESYNRAVLNYDNSIKEAQLANNSALAQIAYEALQSQLELSLQGFQYKNTLILQKTDALNNTNDRYYQRYQNVLSQINTENSMKEQVRQYNETMAFNKQQAAQEQKNWEKQYALSKASASKSSSRSSGSSSSSSKSSSKLTNGSSSSSSKLTNSSSSKSSASKSATLSQGGNRIYNTALTMYNGGNKSGAKTYITDMYTSGKLSDSDLSVIATKLKL